MTKKSGGATKTFKVKFATYTCNGGDGSAYPLFFRNEERAEAYANKADDERFCEDIQTYTLEFDEDGNLVKESRE